MTHRVSVVVPTLGRESLRRALDSVRRQTVPVDETFVVLDRPSEADRVRRWLQDEHLVVTSGAVGGGAARNIGLHRATGDFVAFLDDDDWWDPAKTESQLRRAGQTAARVLFTDTAFHQRDGRTRRLPLQAWSPPSSLADYLVQRRHFRHGDGYIQSSSLMVLRQLAEQVPWDETLPKHQDWDWVIRLHAAGGSPDRVAEPLVHVVQASAESVSAAIDWRLSLPWWEKHRDGLGRRARTDFLCTQVLRPCLAAGKTDGLRFAAAELRQGGAPHIGAVINLVYGIATRLRRSAPSRRGGGRSAGRPGVRRATGQE